MFLQLSGIISSTAAACSPPAATTNFLSGWSGSSNETAESTAIANTSDGRYPMFPFGNKMWFSFYADHLTADFDASVAAGCVISGAHYNGEWGSAYQIKVLDKCVAAGTKTWYRLTRHSSNNWGDALATYFATGGAAAVEAAIIADMNLVFNEVSGDLDDVVVAWYMQPDDIAVDKYQPYGYSDADVVEYMDFCADVVYDNDPENRPVAWSIQTDTGAWKYRQFVKEWGIVYKQDYLVKNNNFSGDTDQRFIIGNWVRESLETNEYWDARVTSQTGEQRLTLPTLAMYTDPDDPAEQNAEWLTWALTHDFWLCIAMGAHGVSFYTAKDCNKSDDTDCVFYQDTKATQEAIYLDLVTRFTDNGFDGVFMYGIEKSDITLTYVSGASSFTWRKSPNSYTEESIKFKNILYGEDRYLLLVNDAYETVTVDLSGFPTDCIEWEDMETGVVSAFDTDTLRLSLDHCTHKMIKVGYGSKSTGGDGGTTVGIHPNDSYWKDDNVTQLLLGGFDHGEPFLLTGSTLSGALADLAAADGNYLRNTLADFTPGTGNRLYPFLERSDGLYDLDQWNVTYWDQLDNLLSQCDTLGIVVSIELWDAWNLRDGAGAVYPDADDNWWEDGPWAPGMNINYTRAETGLENTNTVLPYSTPANPFFFSVPALNNKPALLAYQEAFVLKAIETAAPYDNVIWQIDNESYAPTEWTDYWCSFLQQHKAGDFAYATDMRNDHDLDAADVQRMLSSPSLHQFLDASQVTYGDQYTLDGAFEEIREFRADIDASGSLRPLNCVKVYAYDGADVDSDLAVDRFFCAIFAGAAGARFHKGDTAGIGLSPAAAQAITAARYLDDHADIDFPSMAPIPLPTLPWGRDQDNGWAWRRDNECYGMVDDTNEVAIFFWASDASWSGSWFNLFDQWGACTVTIDWYNLDNGDTDTSPNQSVSDSDDDANYISLVKPSAPNDVRWCAIVKKV